MTSHIPCTAFGATPPATLSPRLLQGLLREVSPVSPCYSVRQRQTERRQEGGAGTMVDTRRRYTVDEWLDSPENTMRAELVEGIPVERMSTTWDHGQVVKVLWISR